MGDKIAYPLVSVVIATMNEEKNIVRCIESIRKQKYPKEKIEIIVVDNYSSDKTVMIAKKNADKVFIKGHKRASQLNFGVERSKGKYVLYPDADMILSEFVIEECINKCENNSYVALYIPEIVIGKGFFIKVRRFERSFYNTTCIDGVRFVRRDRFLEVGGFDEDIEFGADDWDFNRMITKSGKVDIIKSPIFHYEGELNLKRYLFKKGEYSKTVDKYINKWGKDDPIIKKQFGARYRLIGVFVENGKWKRLLTNPIFMFSLFFLRFMVGIQYIKKKRI